MSDEGDSKSQLNQRFEALFAAYKRNYDARLLKSGSHVAREIRRLAKAERQLNPYIRATYCLMVDASCLLQLDVGCDTALELIALLEHEDRARLIQPNFDQGAYEYYRSRVLTCAYDNLAEYTALMHGYNSEGMYACIRDGMQICRRTGKLECLRCFREYATEVYTAADDFPMALHNARQGITHIIPGKSDRRWLAARDEFHLLLMQGHIDEAFESMYKVWSLRETYPVPVKVRLESTILLDQLLIVSGRIDERARWFSEDELNSHSEPHPVGEHLEYDLTRDCNDSLSAFCSGDLERSIRLLEVWDAALRRQKCLAKWFDVRLRLLATLRLSGRTQKITALAAQLTTEATAARDWLTIRRLRRVLDPNAFPTPLALLDDLTVGPFARPPMDAVVVGRSGSQPIPFCNDEQDRESDAVASRSIAGARVTDSEAQIRQLKERYERLASSEAIASDDELESILLMILDLDPESASNHEMAGDFYLKRNNEGEAERCLARAFRLDRTKSSAAMSLADLYQQSDRARDELAVLDLCLREGTSDEGLLLQAAMTANRLQQFELMLTYLDRFKELRPDLPRIWLYRATALLELDRPAEALAAAERETPRLPEDLYAVQLQRASAFVLLNQFDEFRKVLGEILHSQLPQAEFLSNNELVRLHRRLWLSVRKLPLADRNRQEYERFLLEHGLLHDDDLYSERANEK